MLLLQTKFSFLWLKIAEYEIQFWYRGSRPFGSSADTHSVVIRGSTIKVGILRGHYCVTIFTFEPIKDRSPNSQTNITNNIGISAVVYAPVAACPNTSWVDWEATKYGGQWNGTVRLSVYFSNSVDTFLHHLLQMSLHPHLVILVGC